MKNLRENIDGLNILITGSQGMLGSGLANRLVSMIQMGRIHPSGLYLASRLWERKSIDAAHPVVTFLTNSDIHKISHKIDVLIHTASPSNITKISNYGELLDVNVNLLDLFKGSRLKTLFFISSGEVYSGEEVRSLKKLSNLDLSNKRNWYPAAKILGEEKVKSLQVPNSLSIRLFHTYGPGVKRDDGRSFADFLWSAAEHRSVVLKSNGSQTRTFLYLEDAIDAILMCLEQPNLPWDTINIGSSIPLSIFEFAKLVAEAGAVGLEILREEDFLHSPNESIIPDISRLRDMGWAAKVSTESGVTMTIDWIRNFVLNNSPE